MRETPEDAGYRILIEASQEEIKTRLAELKTAIEKGEMKALEFKGLKAIWFGRHLYQPLLYLEGSIIEIHPAPLNDGERRFVEDVKTYHQTHGAFFDAKELYLLRNLSKGRGVGFFEAGNFHPDFILWLVAGSRQRVAFVDPKGIRNLGATDPKIQFYQTIKEIEQRLGDRQVVLDSFIISTTPAHVMRRLWAMDQTAMEAKHILFPEEESTDYVEALFRYPSTD